MLFVFRIVSFALIFIVRLNLLDFLLIVGNLRFIIEFILGFGCLRTAEIVILSSLSFICSKLQSNSLHEYSNIFSNRFLISIICLLSDLHVFFIEAKAVHTML